MNHSLITSDLCLCKKPEFQISSIAPNLSQDEFLIPFQFDEK